MSEVLRKLKQGHMHLLLGISKSFQGTYTDKLAVLLQEHRTGTVSHLANVLPLDNVPIMRSEVMTQR